METRSISLPGGDAVGQPLWTHSIWSLAITGVAAGAMAWAISVITRRVLAQKKPSQLPSEENRTLRHQEEPQQKQQEEPQQKQRQEPQHLLCPITHALFRDPVFVVDSGNTYEREAVLAYWTRVGEARDPLTNVHLPSRDVRTNWAVRRDVQAFLDEQPDYVPDGWDSREMLPPDRPVAAPAPEREEEEPAGPAAEEADEDGLNASARAHCRAVAEMHGGTLSEPLIAHFAAAFQVEADALRRAFGQPRHVAPEAEARAAGPRAERDRRAALPPRVRAHCDAIARTLGGTLPEQSFAPLAASFGVDEAALRSAYGPAQEDQRPPEEHDA